MKLESNRQDIDFIISSIKDEKIDVAIRFMNERRLHYLAGKILYTMLIGQLISKKNCIRYVDHYAKCEDSELWYKDDGIEKSVLLDFSKVLGVIEGYPTLWEKSSEMMQRYICSLMKRDRKVRVNELYSFRSPKDYVLSELSQNEISISSPESFNDPFDCLILSSIRNEENRLNEICQKYCNKTFIEELRKIRVRCFVGQGKKKEGISQVLNPLMWAHYADSHKGICIKLNVNNESPLLKDGTLGKFTKGRIDHVIYKDKLIESNNDALDYKKCFLTKSRVWKYEDEYRLVYYDANRAEKYYTLPLADLGLEIKEIYIGLNCDESYRQLIQSLLKGRNIEMFHIERDKNYLNKLKIVNGVF